MIPAPLETFPCPKCGSSSLRRILEGEDFLHELPGVFYVSCCNQCGLWFQNPRPSVDQLKDFYPSDYGPHSEMETGDKQNGHSIPLGMAAYLSSHFGYRLPYQKKMSHLNFWWKQKVGEDLIPTFVPEGKLIDIGCGSGKQLMLLKYLGWTNLYGIELVPSAGEKAAKQGFKISVGALEEELLKFPDQTFDVIYCTMVMEHLENPFLSLKKIASKLKSGGEFLFSTIVRDSLDSHLYGRYWAGLDLPRHLIFLTRAEIREMLADDFTDVTITSQRAVIDFIRSSTWKTKHGKASWLDRVILSLGEKKLRWLLLVLSFLGLTCRVSIRCKKK